MMRAHPVTEGMKVRTADGEKLGRVVLTGERTFQIEKGYFFPKEYVARYDDVQGVEEDTVVLAMTRDELLRGLPAQTAGAAPPAVPETQEPDDPRERRRLEQQLETARQRQWAQQPGATRDRHADAPARAAVEARVERETFRVGDAEPVGGTRLRHREYAVGYSEARGEMIAFESEYSSDGESHRTTRMSPDEVAAGDASDENSRERVAADMAGTGRRDPGEHP